MKPKKLLFIVNVDWFFISHRLPIALAAKKEGYEVHVACGMTDKQSYLDELGLITHSLNLSRGSTGITQEIKSLIDIKNVLKNTQPDIIHFVTIKPVLYGGIVARFMHLKNKVFAISGLGYVFTSDSLKTSVLKFFIVQLYKIAIGTKNSKVIVQNTNDKDLLINYNIIKKEQAILIRGSGVKISAYPYKQEPSDTPMIVMASRLLKDKGVMEFIDAARILLATNINAKFALYGDIDEHNPASLNKDELAKIKTENIVEVYGHVQNIAHIFSNAHIIVLPSYREGLPKVLIEAAASGRAVVTTDVPGCRDAIDAEKTGLLVKVKDSQSLANAIKKLIQDRSLRISMGDAGRALAKSEFTIEKVIATHLSIYQSFYEDNK
jgi:glycosyltransferase involved in cell wall biosynthesis